MTSPLYPRATKKSRTSKCAKCFMMCHRIGRPPISTIGFGRTSVSSARRVPRPPARITHFIEEALYRVGPSGLEDESLAGRHREHSHTMAFSEFVESVFLNDVRRPAVVV